MVASLRNGLTQARESIFFIRIQTLSFLMSRADQETCGGGREGTPSREATWAKSWKDDKLWDGDVTETDFGMVPVVVEHNSDQGQDRQMW